VYYPNGHQLILGIDANQIIHVHKSNGCLSVTTQITTNKTSDAGLKASLLAQSLCLPLIFFSSWFVVGGGQADQN
jgi:hypothetical protein